MVADRFSVKLVAVVRIPVVAPGTYSTRNGDRSVTSERIDHWIDQFNHLTAANVRIPIPWGHNSKAKPQDADDHEFERSRFNAGYLKALEKGEDGRMFAAIDAPGLEQKDGSVVSVAKLDDGTPVTTAIKEVSLYANDWTDGKGVTHSDIIQHIALTPLPVYVDQQGFTEMATELGKNALILAIPVDGDGDGKANESEKSDKPKSKLEDTMDPKRDDETPKSGEGDKIGQIVKIMAEVGAPLPDGTDKTNFLDRMLTAFTVLLARKQERDQEEETETDDEPPVEEDNVPGGMTMATLEAVKADPYLAKLVADDNRRKTVDHNKRVDALIARGLKPVDAAKLKVDTGATFATDAKARTDYDAKAQTLDILESSLPAKEWADLMLGTVHGGDVSESTHLGTEDLVEYAGMRMTKAEKAEIEARVARNAGTKA